MKPNYILQKDLPNCPKGRIFKPTNDGKHYFLSMTDNEVINGNLHDYKFKADEVENNILWFRVEKISDLKSQLESALNEKRDVENKISSLKKRLKK
jgi:hypothetical protein